MATAPPSPGNLLDRVPPQSIEAEQGVIGSVLQDNEVLHDVVPLLRPEHFYRDAHQKIYRIIRDLYERGNEAVDLLILREQLKDRGQLEDVGGAPYLAEIWESVPHAANAEYYARIVRDKAVLRDLIHASTEVLRGAYDNQQAPDELLAESERNLFRILEQREGGDSIQVSDILKETFDRIKARLDLGGGVASGLKTGFADLDNLTSGLQNSELVILAARPSMGKTALALNIAANAAVKNGAATLIVSLEQSRLEIGERLLCASARVDAHRLRNGYVDPSGMKTLVRASGELAASPLFIDDTPGRTMIQIAAMARRLKRRADLRLIVIDYLQLIDADNSRDPRQEQIAQIARRLKHLARELNVPVLALAQLNRSVEMREGHRPRLADLRESGAIEQDADVVVLLHRPAVYDHTSGTDSDGQPVDEYEAMEARNQQAEREREAELIIAKQRNGPTGIVKLTFLKEFMRFESCSEAKQPADVLPF